MTRQEWREMCDHPPLVLDGAWGTQLQQQDIGGGGPTEALNLTDPEKVRALAESYVNAGSAIILTNTFGGSRIMLERHGLADRTTEINQAGAQLSKSAAGTRARVFGSIGPTGKMLMMGDTSEEELATSFEEQASALKEGGVDGIVIETMSDLEEARLAVRAALPTGLPIVACMVYDSGPDSGRTMMGKTPAEAAETLEEAGAWALGANCGQGPEGFENICTQYRDKSTLPLWFKPNAGLPELVGGKPVYRMTSEEFARKTVRLWQAGAVFVGGCCGTNPEFIKALRTEIL